MVANRITRERRASYRFLLQWIAIALVAGVCGASVLALFRTALELLAGFIASFALPPPVVSAAAAILVGLVIYRISPDAAGEGMPSYLYALSESEARFPLRVTLWKLPAALLTLAGFGMGGVVGPVGRVVAGLMSLLGFRRDGSRDARRARTAAICGMAATVAALFHAPIAGGIFAVEIIQRANMRYRELFPAALAGAASVWVSRLFGWKPLITIAPPGESFPLAMTPWLLLFAVLIGFLSGAFVRGYAFTVRLFQRDNGHPGAKVLIGMVATGMLAWFVSADLSVAGLTSRFALGARSSVLGVEGLVDLGAAPLWAVALILLLVQAAGSYLTTGSGMSAGLTGPSIQIGLFAGVAATAIYGSLGLSAAAGGAEGMAFLVIGLVGMLAGAMNVPIAAAILGVELFGARYAIPAVFAAVIAFQLNRHETIYDYAVAGSGNLFYPADRPTNSELPNSVEEEVDIEPNRDQDVGPHDRPDHSGR